MKIGFSKGTHSRAIELSAEAQNDGKICRVASEKKQEDNVANVKSNSWQSMETAPTDGRRFDVWCVSATDGTISFEYGARFTDVQMRGDKTGFGYVLHLDGVTKWEYLDRDEGTFPGWKPVAWMEIPDKPKFTQKLE